MSKVMRIVALIAAVSLVSTSSVLAEPPPPIPIDINISIGEVLALDAQARNISNDAPAGVSFNTVGVTTADPWRVSDQYIFIEYTANTAVWGVRLMSDNKTAWPTLAGNKVASGEPTGEAANWDDGDEILSYSGIVNTGALLNPTMRASLGWQVYADKVAKPANPTDASYSGNPYSSVWAYLSDKKNHVMAANGTRQKKADGITDLLAGEQGVITGTTAGGENIFNYALPAHGGIGQALAQHPEVLPTKVANDTDGDGQYDIAVYLSARFANTDYSGAAPVNFVLPGGSYSTTLYVEMILE